jgi:hypothetical protein
MNDRWICIPMIAAMLLAAGCASQRGKDPSLKQSAREVGTTLGTATREVGHEAKKAGKAIGEAAKEGGRAFKDAFKAKD